MFSLVYDSTAKGCDSKRKTRGMVMCMARIKMKGTRMKSSHLYWVLKFSILLI
jgi:hypothetical protein